MIYFIEILRREILNETVYEVFHEIGHLVVTQRVTVSDLTSSQIFVPNA